MSEGDVVKVKCLILEERDASIQIEQKQGRATTARAWLIRSQVQNVVKRSGFQSTVEIPQWVAEEKGLEYNQ